MLDGVVHFTDLFRYHLGNQAQSVFASSNLRGSKRRRSAWRSSNRAGTSGPVSLREIERCEWRGTREINEALDII